MNLEILILGVLGTVSSLYLTRQYLNFKVSENRKQREHLQKIRKLKYEHEYKDKKLDKTPNIDGNMVV